MGHEAYIGDGVYAEEDGYGIILYTSDGISRTNTIYLEPILWDKIVKYIDTVKHAVIEEGEG